jgi:hypothetical protein
VSQLSQPILDAIDATVKRILAKDSEWPAETLRKNYAEACQMALKIGETEEQLLNRLNSICET